MIKLNKPKLIKIYRYEVGFKDDFIGIYPGKNIKEAIDNCKRDMKHNNMWNAHYAKLSIQQQWIVHQL